MTATYILGKRARPELRESIIRNAFAKAKSLPTNRNWEIVIREHHEKRTSPQNSYYFGVVIATIAKHTGYSPDEVHELAATLFLPDGEVEIGGKTIMRRKSTAKLSKVEFGDYIDRVIAWAASEAGVVIPAPMEVWGRAA